MMSRTCESAWFTTQKVILCTYTRSKVMDQGIQRAITFLFLNRISKPLHQVNWLPVRQNHVLSLFVNHFWKKDTKTALSY